MKFRIIDITSSESMKVRGFPAYVQVKTNELFELGDNEVGIILGKHHLHDVGVGTFGGILNPKWRGHLTIELNVFGEFEIQKNEKIAHVVIFEQ